MGNKAKGRILKWKCVEKEARQIFQSIRGYEMSIFRKIWPTLFSCYLRFEIRLFALLPMNTNGTGIRILDRFDISLSTHQTYTFHQTNTQSVSHGVKIFSISIFIRLGSLQPQFELHITAHL